MRFFANTRGRVAKRSMGSRFGAFLSSIRQRSNGIAVLLFSTIALALLGLKIADIDGVSSEIDAIAITILVISFAIVIIPWKRLSTLKFGQFEVALDQAKDALSGLRFAEPGFEGRIRDQIDRWEFLIPKLSGARMLWIDDNPALLVGERRFFRALGIHVTVAQSSQEAERILTTDGDFDLIVTDISRRPGSLTELKALNDPDTPELPSTPHEGVDFLLLMYVKYKDHRIRSIPVLFYSMFLPEQLRRFTASFHAMNNNFRLANEWRTLIDNVVWMITESRSRPVVFDAREFKIPR